MKSYKLVKNSRSEDSTPYAGPTCGRAKVRPGRVYHHRLQADLDVRRLNEQNSVGFRIVTMGEGKDDTDILEILINLATDCGRHFFGIEMIAETAGEPQLEVQQAAYRLRESGKAGFLPPVPEIDDAYKITSVCLSTEVPI